MCLNVTVKGSGFDGSGETVTCLAALLMSRICTDKNLCLFLKDTVTVLLDLTAIMIFFPPGFK